MRVSLQSPLYLTQLFIFLLRTFFLSLRLLHVRTIFSDENSLTLTVLPSMRIGTSVEQMFSSVCLAKPRFPQVGPALHLFMFLEMHSGGQIQRASCHIFTNKLHIYIIIYLGAFAAEKWGQNSD